MRLLRGFLMITAAASCGPDQRSAPPPTEPVATATTPADAAATAPADASDAAADAPAPPPPPHDNDEPTVSGGSIDKAAVRRVIKRNLPSVHLCIETALLKTAQADIGSRFDVKFTIGLDGKVAAVRVMAAKAPSPELERCIAKAFERMRFPAPSGGTVEIGYQMIFDWAG